MGSFCGFSEVICEFISLLVSVEAAVGPDLFDVDTAELRGVLEEVANVFVD